MTNSGSKKSHSKNIAPAQEEKRKRLMESLLESEQLLRSITSAAKDAIVMADSLGNISYWNPAAENMFGYQEDEVIGESLIGTVFLESSADVSNERLEQFGKTGTGPAVGETSEMQVKRKDGTEFPIEVSLSRVNIRDQWYSVGIMRDITERNRLEEAYHSLVDNSIQGLAIVQDGRMVFLNKTFTSTTGYSREDLLAASPEQLQSMVHPEDRELIWARHRDRIAGKPVPPRYEFRWIRKDGSTCWVEIYASKIEYQGRPAIQTAYIDITERKKAEEELCQYDHIVSSSTDMMSLLNKRFIYMAVNSSYLKAFRKTSDEVIGHTVSDVFGKEFFEAVIKPNAERCLAGEDVNYQAWFDFPAYELRYMDINYYPYIDSNNEVSGFVVNGRDITDHKKTQEALHQSEETARVLLDATMDSGLLIDREGIIIDLNDKMAISLGKTREDMIGIVIYDYLPADLAEQRKAIGVEVLRTRKPIHFEDQRGERWLENSVYPIFDTLGEVNQFAIYSRDITERKRAEEKLLDYQTKLKSLSSQLSVTEERERRRIATDLHDHIGQSLVFSKLKLDELQHSANSIELTKALNEISNNIDQVITDTRTLTFDLSSPILNEIGFETAVASWLDEQVREKYGIETEFEDDGQQKMLDADIQALLFRNVRELLINVVKHANAQNVKVSVGKVDDLINISVEDNGDGFEPADVASKATFGLFSIRERLEQLGGSFEIDSEPGSGSKFTMTAPLKQV